MNKTFEIRDRSTFIPTLAVQLDPKNEQDRYLLARAGFGRLPTEQRQYIFLVHLEKPRAEWDPIAWNDRTMYTAHQHIVEWWADLNSGDVIDVEYLLKESESPKRSESGR